MWTIRLGVGYVVDANGQLSRWYVFDIVVPIYTQNWPLLLMTVEIINLVYNLSHGHFEHVWSVVWELTLRVLRRFGLLGDVDLEFRLKMMRKHLLHVQLTSKQRFTLLFRMWPLMEYLVSVGLFCKPSRLHIRNFNIQTIKKTSAEMKTIFTNVETCLRVLTIRNVPYLNKYKERTTFDVTYF